MILLDTNTLLWLVSESSRLGPGTRELLAGSEVYSSAVSIIEVRVKEALGKLAVPPDFVARLRQSGLLELPLTHEHADALSAFPELAGHDPFDRLLLAQAYSVGATLITADRVLLDSGHPFVRDARV